MEIATLVAISVFGLLVSFTGYNLYTAFGHLSTTKRSIQGTQRLVEVMSLPILLQSR